MKPKHDPLERLFYAAARAPRCQAPTQAPFLVESRALADWRSNAAVEDWLNVLPIFRWGLALAGGVALVAVAVSCFELKESSDEIAIIDSVMTVSYLP